MKPFLLAVALGTAAIAGPAQAQLKFNPNQVAILRWYQATQAASFSVGNSPVDVAYDGANIWLANAGDDAVVPLDGGKRKVAMSATESPENWFEDFGSAQLINGVAVIQFDPGFHPDRQHRERIQSISRAQRRLQGTLCDQQVGDLLQGT